MGASVINGGAGILLLHGGAAMRLIRLLLFCAAFFASVAILTRGKTAHADELYPDQSIGVGDILWSPNGQYYLGFQHNPNVWPYTYSYFIRIYGRSDYPQANCALGIWTSLYDYGCGFYGTGTHMDQTGDAGSGAYALMQGDGNFVLYTSGGSAKWATLTYGHTLSDNPYLSLQSDSNLVLYYSSGIPLWSIF